MYIFLSKIVMTYPLSRSKLIGGVACIRNLYGHQRNITIVVAPVRNTSRQCNDISLPQTVHFLVFISKPLLALALSSRQLLDLLLEGLERLRTARKCDSLNASSYRN